MDERRHETRTQASRGGAITLADGISVLSCIVRDRGTRGAKLEFDSTACVPEAFELTMEHCTGHFAARAVWRTRDTVGVVFHIAEAKLSAEVLQRLRAVEPERIRLHRRVAELTA